MKEYRTDCVTLQVTVMTHLLLWRRMVEITINNKLVRKQKKRDSVICIPWQITIKIVSAIFGVFSSKMVFRELKTT